MASLAGMLEVEVADLESALLTRVLAVSGEVMHKKHNLSGNKYVISTYISDRKTDFYHYCFLPVACTSKPLELGKKKF